MSFGSRTEKLLGHGHVYDHDTATTSVFTQRVPASSHQRPSVTAGYALIPYLGAGSRGHCHDLLRLSREDSCQSPVVRGRKSR
jgi:hypothetical protein